MKRRSFQLSEECRWRLQNIQSFQNHANVSQTVRFCIDFAYEAVCAGTSEEQPEGLSEVAQKNNLILRFILIELVKMHEGEVKPLSEAGKEYLKELKQQMQHYLEKTS